MPLLSADSLHNDLALVFTLGVVGYGLAFMVLRMSASRPGVDLKRPLITAVVLRIVAAAGVSAIGIGNTLRGGDEDTFIAQAGVLRHSSLLSSSALDTASSNFHVWIFALQLKYLDSTAMALRITQIAFTVAGLVFIIFAVYDLAGPRAAGICAWILALEPTNVFFASLLHKEPLMYLAEGMVVYAGVQIWKRPDVRPLATMALGCGLAIITRRYAGEFLLAAAAATVLHASLRSVASDTLRSLSLLAVVVMVGALTAPTFWAASDSSQLAKLQASQTANSTDSSNLKLESVDFSTRGNIIKNLPQRVRDVLLRPYPWQLGSDSQRIGALGALVVLASIVYFARLLFLGWGSIMGRAGPFVYVAIALLFGYSLAAGNAGTAFRYRTHVEALLLGLLVVLAATPAVRRRRATVPAFRADDGGVAVSGPLPWRAS